MTVRKLSYMPYANAKVIIDDDWSIYLQSYSTIVCIIKDGRLSCTGTYSSTTRKHISAFMREYTDYSYHEAKKCYTDKCELNLSTGEFIPVE